MKHTTCTIPDCAMPHTSRGWCTKHYYRWIRNGDPLAVKRQRCTDPEERLKAVGWDEQQLRPSLGACWIWRGTRTCHGYARFSMRSYSQFAHRVSYQVWVGPIPDGLVVRHRCDNPPCIRPEHLEVGTVMDNTWDYLTRVKGYGSRATL